MAASWRPSSTRSSEAPRESSEPPVPYTVAYSGLVIQRLRQLASEATARGDGPAFAAALKEFDRRLRIFPQFGDPQIDLSAGGGQLRLGIIRPLSMRYGVNEDLRMVFCTAPPTLLPPNQPAAAAGE